MENIDRSKLSRRENEILELAIDGLTDQQIALRVGISPSTVNSYWVRIRGKLGALSRTEMVSKVLRGQSEVQLQALQKKNELYQEEAQQHDRQDRDYASAELYSAALQAMPEAVLVRDNVGRILYANDCANRTFGYDDGELTGSPIAAIIPEDPLNASSPRISTCVALREPLRFGIDHVVFGRNRNGRSFRVIASLKSNQTSSGIITVCLVRSFLAEVDDLRRHTHSVVAAY